MKSSHSQHEWRQVAGRRLRELLTPIHFLLPHQYAQMDVIASARVRWGDHCAPEELCPTCISTPVAGKSPACRQEFPGKGCRWQCHSAGIGAGRGQHRSCLLWCSSTGRGDIRPVRRMLSEHYQAYSGGQGNISAVDMVSDRVQ